MLPDAMTVRRAAPPFSVALYDGALNGRVGGPSPLTIVTSSLLGEPSTPVLLPGTLRPTLKSRVAGEVAGLCRSVTLTGWMIDPVASLACDGKLSVPLALV